MANPFASHSGSDWMLPMMMMSLQNQPKAPAPPASQPMGTPSTYKPQNAASSFVGGVSAPPTSGQTGMKTLLGQ